ncbi:hypothetical protein G9O61_00g020390 [Vairimorpha ceranae]|nr:hypothetical protein G9O61_00g020390 [Vairimorpha ceranae]
MNATTGSSKYISKSRKFHDSWAFILYAISFLGFSTYAIVKEKSFSLDLSFAEPVIKNALFCSIVVLAAITINFLGFRFIPVLFLKATAFTFPFVLIATLFFFKFHAMSLFYSLFAIFFWAVFVYRNWVYFDAVAKTMCVGVKIILSNFFTTLIGIIMCLSLIILQIFLMTQLRIELSLHHEKMQDNIFTFFYVLNLFWTLSNAIYFFKVYITSVVSYNLVEFGEHSRMSSVIKNSMYALGSICFAGLVVAVVSTLRFFVDQERDRRSNNRDRNGLVSIILCLMAVLLSVLEDIIEFINALTLPYIAVHGEGYIESVKKSYDISLRRNPIAAIGMAALNISLFITQVSVTSICLGFSITLAKSYFNDMIILKSIIYSACIPLICFSTIMMVFSSAFLGIIYIKTENEDLIISKYKSELNAAFENK